MQLRSLSFQQYPDVQLIKTTDTVVCSHLLTDNAPKNIFEPAHAFNQETHGSLEKEVEEPKDKISRPSTAMRVREPCQNTRRKPRRSTSRLHRYTDIWKIVEAPEEAVGALIMYQHLHAATMRNVNFSSFYVDVDSRNEEGNPDSCEAQLKAAVLRNRPNDKTHAKVMGTRGS